jgi:hypothetical protein
MKILSWKDTLSVKYLLTHVEWLLENRDTIW